MPSFAKASFSSCCTARSSCTALLSMGSPSMGMSSSSGIAVMPSGGRIGCVSATIGCVSATGDSVILCGAGAFTYPVLSLEKIGSASSPAIGLSRPSISCGSCGASGGGRAWTAGPDRAQLPPGGPPETLISWTGGPTGLFSSRFVTQRAVSAPLFGSGQRLDSDLLVICARWSRPYMAKMLMARRKSSARLASLSKRCSLRPSLWSITSNRSLCSMSVEPSMETSSELLLKYFPVRTCKRSAMSAFQSYLGPQTPSTCTRRRCRCLSRQ
mmetsp:Transcript_101328/g.194224  ORF Transcript_101328/g.194224 Transcript_101328/m.194224 type:complete len:270 (+) Transcript_101328:148-957(+)